MIICSKCNFKCEDGSKFCTKCSNKLTGNVKSNTKEKFVKNTNIFLAEGEVNVKSYHCTTFPNNPITRFFSLATDGYASVTNKRVIFFADGKTGVTMSEVDIDKVSGVVSQNGKGWNLLALLIWGILYIAQLGFILSSFEYLSYDFDFKILITILVSIGIFIATICIGKFFIRPWLYKFFITGSGVETSKVGAGNIGTKTHWWVLGVHGDSKSIKLLLPGRDSERAIRELRAVVKDIQTLGEFGIEKWTENNSACNLGQGNVNSSMNNNKTDNNSSATEGDFF